VKKNKEDPAPDAVTSLQLTSDPEVDLDGDRVWLPFLGDTADICPLCEQGHMQPAWAIPGDDRDWETCPECGFTQPVGGGE
jgi:hypothetical protein